MSEMELNMYPVILQGLINSIGIFWPYYLLLLFFIVTRLVWLIYKQYLLTKAGMPEIDRMTGDEFEQRLGILFEKLGYKVDYVGSHRGDYGADLVIEKASVRRVVQAKRHTSYIPERAVQEAVAAIKMYKAQRAMVVTNNYFSRAAWTLARANNVELWDRDELARRLVSDM